MFHYLPLQLQIRLSRQWKYNPGGSLYRVEAFRNEILSWGFPKSLNFWKFWWESLNSKLKLLGNLQLRILGLSQYSWGFQSKQFRAAGTTSMGTHQFQLQLKVVRKLQLKSVEAFRKSSVEAFPKSSTLFGEPPELNLQVINFVPLKCNQCYEKILPGRHIAREQR